MRVRSWTRKMMAYGLKERQLDGKRKIDEHTVLRSIPRKESKNLTMLYCPFSEANVKKVCVRSETQPNHSSQRKSISVSLGDAASLPLSDDFYLAINLLQRATSPETIFPFPRDSSKGREGSRHQKE